MYMYNMSFSLCQDSWDSVLEIILHYATEQDQFQPFAGPGHWNDPDQLIIGDFGLSLDQQMAQMALWAIYASVSDGSTRTAIILMHINVYTCKYLSMG